jgi:hypothetical protein
MPNAEKHPRLRGVKMENGHRLSESGTTVICLQPALKRRGRKTLVGNSIMLG